MCQIHYWHSSRSFSQKKNNLPQKDFFLSQMVEDSESWIQFLRPRGRNFSSSFFLFFLVHMFRFLWKYNWLGNYSVFCHFSLGLSRVSFHLCLHDLLLSKKMSWLINTNVYSNADIFYQLVTIVLDLQRVAHLSTHSLITFFFLLKRK
jgi:hypothetical protein